MTVLAFGSTARAQEKNIDETYQERIPIGTEALRLGKTDQVLYLLAMAEASQFEGWHLVRVGHQTTLTDASGVNVTAYPETVRFRVTVSTRKDLLQVRPFPSTAPDDLNTYLLNLRFLVRMFRGLKQTVLQPMAVRLIGVPEDVPYDERVYEVTFHLVDLPITDRCQLEVHSPSGTRLARFHLDLY